MTKKKKKPGPKLATWLLQLPYGEYTLNQLVEITGLEKGSIVGVMTRRKIKKKYVPGKTSPQVVYIWQGKAAS